MSRQRRPLALRPIPSGDVPRTAMVLAAGLGKRMRPLTATRPKPLVEVAGKPLLDHCLDRLRAAGVEKAVVNVHYLADALEAHLKNRVEGLEIAVSDERDQLLETGGGLVRALPLIDADPFLVVNSDNLWVDGPVDSLRLLAANWDEDRMDALLLLVPLARAHCHKGQGDFHMSAAGALRRRKAGGSRRSSYRRPDRVEAPARGGRAGGASLDQPAVGPRHRQGPAVRCGPRRPLVRHRRAGRTSARPRKSLGLPS